MQNTSENDNETDQLMSNITMKINRMLASEITASPYGIYVLLTILGIIIYLVIPFFFRFSATIQRHVIFLHRIGFSSHRRNFYDPEVHGMEGARNIYLNSSKQGVRIGLWHMLPKSVNWISKKNSAKDWDDAIQNSGKPVFVYFHGNSGNRGTAHRLELYTFLQELDCHVIAFDYRGFGDSSSVQPSETGVVADGLTVYIWLSKILGSNSNVPIYFWGHSLGTGVSSHLAAKLSYSQGEKSNPLSGLILESPFSNMKDEITSIYITSIYRFLPWFHWCFGTTLENNDCAFTSDLNLQKTNIPILILHVVNDIVVPYRLGKKLYESVLKFRSKIAQAKPIYFKKLTGYSLSDAHVFICREPKLSAIINQFMESSLKNECCTTL